MSTVDTGLSVSDVAELPEPLHVEWVERIWRFWCSLKLLIVLLFWFAGGMVLGTFVNPSMSPLSEIEASFQGRPFVLWLYRNFELYDLYHSWWFTLNLLMLAQNLVACTIERLPRIWIQIVHTETRMDENVARALRLRSEGKVPGSAAALAEKVQERMRQLGFRPTREERPDGSIYLFGETARYARLGVWVVHLALLMILGGGIVGRLYGFEGTMNVAEGGGEGNKLVMRSSDGAIFSRPLGFTVRCNDFVLEEFKNGQPKAFKSDLSIIKNGKEVERKTIIVNDPLHYGGMAFYQASYQQAPEMTGASIVLVDQKTGARRPLQARPREEFAFDDAATVRYAVVGYEPEFGALGPAAQVTRREGEADPTSFWVFSRDPGFDGKNREDRYAIEFSGLQAGYYTGLQIAHDPGIPPMWTGIFIFWIGLFIAFYRHHRRVWARVREGEILIAGSAHRNPASFELAFDEMCADLGVPRT